MKGKSSKRTLKLPMSMVSVAVLLLSMTFTFLAVVPVVAQEPVEARVSAPEEEVEEGESFVVTIDVGSITNLSSGQFDLSFDPAVVKASDVKDGEINGEDVPIAGWILNSMEDTVTVVIMLSFGEVVSGSGYLAEIEFDVVGEAGAESALDISNELLTTIVKGEGKYYTDEEIPANWINATIRIGGEEEEEEDEEEEDEEPTPSPSLTPTPTLAPGETPDPTPSPTRAPGETPSPTPTLAPGVTPAATPTLAPGITPTKKPAAKAKATPTPTPTPKPAGFEVIFAIVVVLVIAYVMRKIKNKKKGR